MKRTLLILITLFGISLYAQQQPVLKNKRGILILPQTGDWSIGIAANPFLTYFGNMFNNSTANNSPSFSYLTPNQIFAKYMKSKDLAYRGSFRLGLNNETYTYYSADMSPGAAPNSKVSDIVKERNTVLGLSLGFEKRKGNTRLQGIYGVEAYINYSSSKSMVEFGNKLEYLDTGTRRVKKSNLSSRFSIGFRGFAGVEYFVAPNFSIGGELGYGPSFNIRSANEQTFEMYDFTNALVVEELVQTSPKSRGFYLDTDNYNGVIKMLFYF